MKYWLSIAIVAIFVSTMGRSQEISRTTGSTFISDTWNSQALKREQLAVKEILNGNVPSFLKTLVPVEVASDEDKLTFYVTPDYLSVGTDQDYTLMPLNFISAAKIANRLGMVLPTSKMVDLIYQQAQVKLKPLTMKPGRKMTSNSYIKKHDQGIKGQLFDKTYTKGQLIAGHKKDTVISKKLLTKQNRIAIYGWHTSNTKKIQNLNIWHTADYADYSHGVRLVDRKVLVNGEIWDIADVLSTPRLAKLISKEGAISVDQLMSLIPRD